MKNKNNLSIGLVVIMILISFVAITFISINTVYNTVQANEKKMTESFSQNVYDAIESELQKPIISGRAIVNTETLIELLIHEEEYSISELEEIFKTYLLTYQYSLDYSTVSIISDKTGNYYTQRGFNKTIDPINDEHDIWYTYFIDQNREYAFDIDVDEVNGNMWTLFMNIRINDFDGNLLGVSGLGVDMTYLQDIIADMEKLYDIKVYFVDNKGTMQLGSNHEGVTARIIKGTETGLPDEFYEMKVIDGKCTVSRPINDLGWIMVVEKESNLQALTLNIVKNNLIVLCVLLGLVVIFIVVLLSKNQYGLIKEREEAQKASEAKGKFLASMSHEIRTPINGILGMDAMLLKICKEEKQIEYAKNIQSAGKTLLSIVNDILDISKIESGKMQIFNEEYHIFDVLNDCYNINISRIQQKGLKFIMDIDPNIPSIMLGDGVRIRQIINNLLSNAAKYTHEGQVKMSVSSQTDAEDTMKLKIIVQDTGVGIRPEDLDKLFESFIRIEEEKNRNIEGTGLGLNLCHQLTYLMNGTIDAKSTYGEGTTFTVEIPQKIVDSTPMGDFVTKYHESILKSEREEYVIYAPEAKILVVDDVNMNLSVVMGFLENTGIQIDTATNGRDCLVKLNECEYDVVFLDHMMPGMDGIQTLNNWNMQDKKYNLNTPIIMLTANALSGAREEYLGAGFADYLSKPVSENDLKAMLLKYIEKKKIVDHSTHKKDKVTYGRNINSNEESANVFDLLANVKGLDIQVGLQNVNYDRDFYLRVLREFVNKEKAKEINEQFNEKNYDSYTILIHGLKNLAITIGLNEFAELLIKQEAAASKYMLEEVKTNHKVLDCKYSEIMLEIGGILEQI